MRRKQKAKWQGTRIIINISKKLETTYVKWCYIVRVVLFDITNIYYKYSNYLTRRLDGIRSNSIFILREGLCLIRFHKPPINISCKKNKLWKKFYRRFIMRAKDVFSLLIHHVNRES